LLTFLKSVCKVLLTFDFLFMYCILIELDNNHFENILILTILLAKENTWILAEVKWTLQKQLK